MRSRHRRPPRRPRPGAGDRFLGWLATDRGAGGITALALVAATVMCALAVVALGGALTTRQRVVAAADGAALAAADALLGAVAGEPCALAARVAAAHRVALAGCRVEGAEVVVETRLELAGVVITADSRAGPAP
ncbi:hypothetical protein H4J02_11700 [Protaetiibacter sp. SSC-01]|uniref:Rv3654c family TadE-like protein n=1 Tax=Protaetiibacter sp. SSC-01 TaxID=2759943 RepID=UPI001656B4C2|nr:Rv3654c family TadE-like protein [Protaetiibacter sp. SSC-01]QNO37108.1 hypothetical protein H4J02_11700 [Protaetiibacter sp. SSC-01]